VKTLLIWEEIPDAITLYLIEDAPDWLVEVHLNYINGDAEGDVLDKLVRVGDALCETPEYYANAEDELAGAWADCKVGQNEAFELEEGSLRVVVAGFIC